MMAAFEELGIMPEISKAVSEIGWELPTDIQSEAIPLILGGGDVLMAAETGSGKTGAFCLPVLQIVWETINIKTSHRCVKNVDDSDQVLLSFNDRHDGAVLSSDHLSCQSKGDNFWAGVRANKGVKRDSSSRNNRFYYEVNFTEPGLARVGWSLKNASLDLGTDRFGFGYGGTAKKSNNRRFDDYGQQFGDRNDVIGCALDLDEGTILFLKNGQNLGVAFHLTGEQIAEAYFPTVCTKNARCSVRFGGNSRFKPQNFSWISELAATKQIIANPNVQTASSSAKILNGPKAVILEPSRELAEQTLKCITDFKKYLSGKLTEVLLIGGIDVGPQIEKCKAGVDIVVATPGRLEDFVAKEYISLKNCRFLILDELDALIRQNQTSMLLGLHSRIPKMFDDGRRLQMIVCSATLHDFNVKRQAERLMYFPTWIDLKGEDSVPDSIHHVIYRVDPRQNKEWINLDNSYVTDGVHAKDHLNRQNPSAEMLSEAVKMMKGRLVIKAIKSLNIDQAIIFCRTKLDCDNLENYFQYVGQQEKTPKRYSCVCMHADRNANERPRNLASFKAGEVRFMICTDVAARGIDVKGVPFVIQVTLPDDKANYLHRIGRVGRADRMGLAISLVSAVPEKVWYHSNCNSRGKNCFNTNLTEQKGCCIWYNEMELLADIEEHLKCTIQEIQDDFQIEVNEFDGKVIYGQKRMASSGLNYANHVEELAGTVSFLSQLERDAQINFLNMSSMKKIRL